jgi:starch-binding outer membrane protein, SusD/RagB family
MIMNKQEKKAIAFRTAIIFTTVMALTATSCKKFLEEAPKDEISSEQYFKTPDHAVNAVNGLYRTGAPQLYDAGGSIYSGAQMMFTPYMSGYIDNEFKGQEIHAQHASAMTFNSDNLSTYIQSIWSNLYAGIARANTAIKYIPTTAGISETQSKQLQGEARYFRALGYFHLVRLFGAVPLITAPYESQENLMVPRSPVDQIYALITSDLEYAINEAGLADVSMANNGSRITKGAAAAVLADAYLTMSGYPLQQNNYAKAAQAARVVISSGKYGLTNHTLNPDNTVALNNTAYNKLRMGDRSATEDIYYYEFAVGIAGSIYANWAFPASVTSETKFSVSTNAYGPTPKFLQGYDPDDDLRIQEKQFFHSSLTRSNNTTVTFNTAPYMWQDDQAAFTSASSGKDFPVYTYPMVLLTAAEAIALSEGVTSEAVGYLADVRSRAYWKSALADIRTQLAGLTPENFVKEVWKERYRELVFQGTIWYDIQRTRLFPVPVAGGDINFEPAIGHANGAGATIQVQNLLVPISRDELQRNPSLTPN